MPLERIDILSLKALPGCAGGLHEKTALVSLRWHGHLEDDVALQALQQRLHETSRTVCPAEPLWGMPEGGWPAALLQDTLAPSTASGFLAQWLVAWVVALQRWAREPVWQGRVLQAQGPQLRLALPYQREPVLRDALQFAVRLVRHAGSLEAAEGAAPGLASRLQAWLELAQQGACSPNTLQFFAAARQRGMPAAWRGRMLQVGWGCRAQRLDGSFTGKTSHLATRTAQDKPATSEWLRQAGLPVPTAIVATEVEQAVAAARRLGWPVVVKPSNQDQGRGVVPGIRDEASLRKAFSAAAAYKSGVVMVERHVLGHDHRLLVLGDRLLAAAQRTPATVIGDGLHTVAQLLHTLNADPRRGTAYRSMLKTVELDDEALGCLLEQGLQADSVVPAGQRVHLRRTANIGTGGTARDILDEMHPDNMALAVRAARVMGLDIAGIDFICPDITRSWTEVGGAICEVNAQPGFRVHWLAQPQRDINGEVLDALFAGQPARIPTAAVTGTNGKTTVAHMLHRIWLAAGVQAGASTTSGLWVGAQLVHPANLSGQPGGRMLLDDPAVEAAVIEMPRKGLLRLGHPCDRYEVAALLNVQDDHIGVDGIDTPLQMAQLKAQVLQRATRAVVINADDPHCLAVRRLAGDAPQILVSRHADNPWVVAHRGRAGQVVFVQQQGQFAWIMQARGGDAQALMPLHDVRAARGGLLRCNETNALFAAALALGLGLPAHCIRQALGCFEASDEINPGRYQFIDGLACTVLLDYGHNPEGVRELCAVASRLNVSGRRLLATAKLGSRHWSHFEAMAPLLAECFDGFLLGCDASYAAHCADYAGADPPGAMLDRCAAALRSHGIAASDIACERDQAELVRQALQQARPGDLLVLLCEPWTALPELRAAAHARIPTEDGPCSS